MLASKDARAVRAAAVQKWGPGGRDVRRRVAAGMDLPDAPARRRVSGSVWAVAMVKDEADIIGPTIDHLREQGVDGVLVVDNGSTDGTRDMLLDRQDSDFLFVGDDHEPAYFQAPKMRLLAQWASRRGADWIVPFDADEWWYGVDDTLAQTLRSSACPVVAATIHNIFPAPGSATGLEAEWRVDLVPARLEKVAYRAHVFAALHHGNHGVSRPGRVGRSLRILHVPWRSEAQFRGKIANGAAALELTGPRVPGVGGDHWRDLGEAEDQLGAIWSGMLAGHGHPKLEWSPSGDLRPIDLAEWSSRWDPDGLLRAR